MHERNDRLAARELIRSGELARGAWLRWWFGAHQPLLAADDPLPALADACGRLREALARPLSRGAA